MGDHKLLDTTQVINGIAVLLSFFVGYKYALKKHDISDESKNGNGQSSNKGRGDGASVSESSFVSFSNNYKMVLVVRNDLKMGKGKIGAQCGHGAVGAYQKAVQCTPRLVRAWENTGCAKIALRVESEREIMAIKRAAEANNLVTCLIRDAGRTQIEPNSKTVLAIGPASVEDIDKVTGHLKLL
ncbi:PREDICTED: probable peptidyl-tRNA hydrolase 2 [Rhagoletis zephyria]|uniref:probable peptidyl-tRNA hydrolase 2 n=1 Tax=Rhagoletis zephyria TaxID=28612 RepID=UPI000811734C|nr:PREDICTED: probable peptidyl-tRNA hydrolase 2 [Rhagoletis zephyria]XP_036324515.1 probable peptidyl-tRNA hydrolase 2 [Rhagoletis pomonella]XP_036324517.1 probable peptidyl-tRNA hydrolase 2 [Rhagoletis pomonella]